MAPTKLTEAERATKLAPLQAAGWTLVEGRDAIHKVRTDGRGAAAPTAALTRPGRD